MPSENEFVFESSVLSQSSFNFFAAMKDKGDYCDIVLKAGNLSISCHSIVIAAAIPHLREALLQRGTLTEVNIPEVDDLEPSAIEAMIEFAYSHKIKCSIVNVMGLLFAASRFQMDEVRDACCNYLANNLHPEDVLKVRDTARNLGCRDLADCTDKYIAGNFVEVSQTDDFLKCTFPHLKELIGRDDLRVQCEEEVYETVMKWISHSVSERSAHLLHLLSEVRLALINPSYLRMHIARNDLIGSSPTCRELVDKITDYHMFSAERDSSASVNTHPRFCKSVSAEKDEERGSNSNGQHFEDACSAASKDQRDEIYCSAKKVQASCSASFCTTQLLPCMSTNSGVSERDNGERTDRENSFEASAHTEGDNNSKGIYAFHVQLSFTVNRFDKKTNTWIVKKTESVNINTASVSRLNNKICFMDCENMCYYNPKENELNFTQRYIQGRAFAGVGDYVYVFGGSDGKFVFDTAKCFDSEEEEWYDLKSMEFCREYAGCAAVEKHVYVLGGNDLNDVHTTVERFDTEAKKWTFAEPMLSGRSRLGAASLNGKIYVCGGVLSLDQEECSDTAEVYDPVDDTWTFISLLKYPLLNFTLVSYSGKLYALGGNDERYNYVNDVAVYDPKTGKWKLGKPMAADLLITGAAVM